MALVNFSRFERRAKKEKHKNLAFSSRQREE